MKVFAISSLIAMLIVAGIGNVAFAQGGLDETYVSPDGFLTLNYPSGWVATPQDGITLLATSQEAIGASDMPSGEAGIAVFGDDYLSMVGASGGSSQEILDALSNAMEISVIETDMTLENYPEALIASLSEDEDSDGIIAVLPLEDGFLVAILVTASGESGEYLDTFVDVANSITFAEPDVATDASGFEVLFHPEVENAGEFAETYGLDISPDGTLLIASGYGDESDYIQVWDFETGEPLQKIEFEEGVFDYEAVAFSADGEIIAKVGSQLVFYDAANGEEVRSLDMGDANFSLIAPRVGDGSGIPIIRYTNEVTIMDLIDAESGESLLSIEEDFEDIRFSQDGDQMIAFLSGDTGNAIRVYDMTTGEEQAELYSGEAYIEGAAISPDGSTAALPLYDSDNNTPIVLIVDVASGETVFEFVPSVDNSIFNVIFSPDGSQIFAAARENILVIDTATGIQLANLQSGIDGNVETMLMNADGTRLAATAYGTTTVWNLSGE